MMTVGSLFSGIGGFDLGLERAGFHIEWQVENNDYCRAVLKKHWPTVPCHYDIKTIDWCYVPSVDLVCGGFPCQPFSCTGKRRGAADDRYLWPEVVRCLSEIKPTWFIGENVPGLLNLGLDQVLADLEDLGYEIQTLSIPACAVDAPHRRDRFWIVSHHQRTVDRIVKFEKSSRSVQQSRIGSLSPHVADPKDTNGRGSSHTKNQRRRHSQVGGCSCGHRWDWAAESRILRVAHGVPHRVDRLKGLGNAVVPQITEALGRMILEVIR